MCLCLLRHRNEQWLHCAAPQEEWAEDKTYAAAVNGKELLAYEGTIHAPFSGKPEYKKLTHIV